MQYDFVIRSARPGDELAIFGLVRALAEYERLSDAVTGNASTLGLHLFGPRPAAEALVVQIDRELVGFALFFANYSTFLTQPGLYLEDLFVLPTQRRRGIGKALLARVAALAQERGAGRLEWSVLDWNASAIEFYQSMGAEVLPDWRICRVTGEGLQQLAAKGPPGE